MKILAHREKIKTMQKRHTQKAEISINGKIKEQVYPFMFL
jgi:hypothetical protein